MNENCKFKNILKVLFTKSYMHCSHPENIEEWIVSRCYELEEFFRQITIQLQKIWNRNWTICPLQAYSPIFCDSKQRFRWWREPNGDRTCEFCGSWHPDEFLKFLDKVIETKAKDLRIEISDNKDKIYVMQPDIHNASEGAIKFRMVHLTKEQCAQNYLKINEVHRLSHEQFMKKYE